MGRRARAHRVGALSALAAAVLAGGAAACVRIDPAPNGVSAVRLNPAPPSIVIGDSLRDSVGAVVPVRGIAYDQQGAVTATATFRFSYLPFRPDTTAGVPIDTALVVDPVTGAVRATPKWVKSVGYVLAEAGRGIQLADTVEIVPRPTGLAINPTDTATVTLRYDCTDDRTTLVQRASTDPDTLLVNTAGPFTLVVQGDSAGVPVVVPRWLVRWSIDTVTAPNPIPMVTLAAGVKVPAIAVATTGGALVAYDTTTARGTATPGTSSVLLRIRPTALDPAFSADSIFYVTLRADVIQGAGQVVPGSPVRGVFRVRLRRSRHPVLPNVANCPG